MKARLLAYKILNSSLYCRVPNNQRDGNEIVWNFPPYIINRRVLNNRERCRPAEMKKFLGGTTNQEILSATMVGRRKKNFISDRLKWLGNLNICRR